MGTNNDKEKENMCSEVYTQATIDKWNNRTYFPSLFFGFGVGSHGKIR